jgi:hypothetical protein
MCGVLTYTMLGIVFLLCWYLGAVLTAFVFECMDDPWIEGNDVPPLILIWPFIAIFCMIALPIIWVVDIVHIPPLRILSPVELAAVLHRKVEEISLLSFPRKVYRWSINQYYKLRGITDL